LIVVVVNEIVLTFATVIESVWDLIALVVVETEIELIVVTLEGTELERVKTTLIEFERRISVVKMVVVVSVFGVVVSVFLQIESGLVPLTGVVDESQSIPFVDFQKIVMPLTFHLGVTMRHRLRWF
jgi:hypothetical protein